MSRLSSSPDATKPPGTESAAGSTAPTGGPVDFQGTLIQRGAHALYMTPEMAIAWDEFWRSIISRALRD